MFLSPPEIQHQKLKSRLGSYDRDDVDELLETIAASYERVWHDRDAARGQIAELERRLRDYEELERPLRDSLVTAQRAADEVRAEAAQHAERVLADARRKADGIVKEAERRRDGINTEIERLKTVQHDTTERCREVLVRALETVSGKTEAVTTSPDGQRSRPRETATRT
ncbi:MAG TPA: DivIVA domain-containing protein [Gaiellaceae bacterium]|jgi:cell division initiation protein|nr:DivIVA domain-containing protein [Gaiellaceae bacterium]